MPPGFLSLPSAAADALRTDSLRVVEPAAKRRHGHGIIRSLPSASAACVRSLKSVAFFSWSMRNGTRPWAADAPAPKRRSKRAQP